MSDTNNNNNLTPRDAQGNEIRLDDESRVKVLSPSMLVLKRFFRNRLAITGLIILVFMFAFSFLGVLFTPYSQTQVFYKYDTMMKDYASVIVNDELRYTVPEGKTFGLAPRSQFILTINKGLTSFSAEGNDYSILPIGDESYRILENEELGTVLTLKGNYVYTETGSGSLPDTVREAFETAQAEDLNSFTLDGETYTVTSAGKNMIINRSSNVALASTLVFDAYNLDNTALINSFPFRIAVEEALQSGENAFTVDSEAYTVQEDGDNITIYAQSGDAPVEFAIGSELIASAIAPDVQISVAFKDAILDAIIARETTFSYPDADGTVIDYEIVLTGSSYMVKRESVTQMYDIYARPSREHWLGTDGNGMDMLTRLMYGGRISLMVGFVVVFIELIIGVIVGGLAGYFGGWVDTLLMRFIDLFNCIPYYPMIIITGSVMDKMEVDPTARIFILMLILGILSWPGIARVVRGQILSLREQDFMVATEATGIPVSRRIFRHLVPNVMPLLIVQGTMALGGVIITEATLSFLGLGLKYPMASWGTIINAATNMYVMQNFWFIWLPAGMLILLTVLGFNFVGDGLRDAFDPKMKR